MVCRSNIEYIFSIEVRMQMFFELQALLGLSGYLTC